MIEKRIDEEAKKINITMPKQEQCETIQNRDKWEEARPQKLPRPTYWPFFFAMGLAFLGLGVMTGWIVAAAGLLLLTIALTGWITDLRYESGKIGNTRTRK
jgi:hypothetical protein